MRAINTLTKTLFDLEKYRQSRHKPTWQMCPGDLRRPGVGWSNLRRDERATRSPGCFKSTGRVDVHSLSNSSTCASTFRM